MHDDRHARHRRRDTDPRRRPSDGYRLRGHAPFARVLADAAALLPAQVHAVTDELMVVIEELPDVDDDAPSLVRVVRGGDRRPCLVLVRRPLELRATSREELTELVAEAIVLAVADDRGWSDEELEDLGWGPDD